ESQHPDLSLAGAQQINDAESSASATAGDAPAHLAHAAGAGEGRAGFGISNKRLLELRIFIVAQIFLHETREQLGLDKAEHASLYGNAVVRQCRMVPVRPNELSYPAPSGRRVLDAGDVLGLC